MHDQNNYDKDLYKFLPYQGSQEELIINCSRKDTQTLQDGFMQYVTEKKEVWHFPKNQERKFLKWVEHYESGFIDKLMKLEEPKNFNDIYNFSKVARKIREHYNRANKKRNKKYTIELFYKLITSLVEVEIFDNKGKKLDKLGTLKTLKNISLKVVKNCSIKEAKIVSKKG